MSSISRAQVRGNEAGEASRGVPPLFPCLLLRSPPRGFASSVHEILFTIWKKGTACVSAAF